MQRRQTVLFFYLCATLSALLLLAASLAQLSFRPGRSFILDGGQVAAEAPGGVPTTSLGDLEPWRLLITAIVLALLGYFVLTLIFSARLRRQLLRRIAGALIAVLVFYLLFSWLGDTLPQLAAPPAASTPPPAQTTTGEPLPPFVAQPSPWLVVIVSLALAAPLIAGIWHFWRRAQPIAHPVTTLAQAAIESIQAGGNVQSIVLRCYLEMSEMLGEQRGIPRQRAMTPREFEQRLAEDGVRDEHIRQLTRLFEGARYGAQAPSARDERIAVECLAAIARAYAGAT